MFLSLLVVVMLTSCEDKETEGISRLTEYADIKLVEGDVVTLTVGETFVEPGYTAFEGETEITDDVVVSGTVDGDNIGAYTITYAAVNEDGFPKQVSRLVLVIPSDLSTIDLTGSYMGRVALGDFEKAANISKIEDGVFYSSDFFGGRYAIGFDYGSAYSLKTYFVLNADNTYTALSTSSPWGPWDIIGGTYDEATNTLSHAVDQGGFGFAVSLIKE